MRTVAVPPFALGGAIQVLDANAHRRNFRICNIGLARAAYGFDADLRPDQGWPIAAADVAGDQGGTDEDLAAHTGAHYVASADGTTVVVVEG